MKKCCVLLLFFVGVLGLFVSIETTYAYPVTVGQSIYFLNGPGDNPGGEFLVYDWDDKDYLFETFCLEKNEYINFGGEFVVYDISTGAIAGGIGGGNPDELDEETAYLYSHFYAGNLIDYVYGNTGNIEFANRAESATELQMAIWFFEDELLSKPTDNYYIGVAETAVQNGWDGLGNVRVMNLKNTNGVLAQSQLVVVPEPSTMLLLGFGLVGLAAVGRKRFH